MTIKKDTRNMGYAISKLFPNAFATYRENIYEVELIGSKKNLFLDWETYEAMKQRLKLLDPESTWMLPKLTQPHTSSEQVVYMQEFINKVSLHEPARIECRLSDELKVFVCNDCYRLYVGTAKISGQNNFTFYCSESGCRGILNQAPLLVRTKSDESRSRMPLVKRISAKKGKCQNTGCPKHNIEEWLGLKSQNPEQPMASLMWVCVNCGENVSPFEPFKMGYKPQEPTESLTKGITVSVAKESDPQKLEKIPLLDYDIVKEVSFSNEVRVVQVTWGYKLGQYENVQYKTFLDNNYYGRELNTQGIIIKLEDSAFQKAKEYLKKCYSEDPEYFKAFEIDISSDPTLQLKRWVLHSLEHALIMWMPIVSGLPHNEFGGSYNLDQNKVIIYDNEDGGIGGCRKLMEDRNNLIDLLDRSISRITECDCISKCPKCLAGLESCGEVNQALNRHLLAPLFVGGETLYV